MVLDGGDEIVLANWPNDKHIICNVNNDIPVKFPSHPYVLVNRNVLCNCGIEADNHYLLESIAACDNKLNNLVMYFTINMAFTNYLDMLPNITMPPLIKDRTMYEQPLLINLTLSVFDNSLNNGPTNVESFINTYARRKEFFLFQSKACLYSQILKQF